MLLLRCCPASPFTLLNYALGSTSLPFSHFFWPSVFGIAPGIAVYVWGGNLIKDLSDVTSGPGGAKALSHAAPPQGEAGAGVEGCVAMGGEVRGHAAAAAAAAAAGRGRALRQSRRACRMPGCLVSHAQPSHPRAAAPAPNARRPPAARVAFAVVSGVTAVAVLVGSAWYTKRAIARRLARVESGGYDAELVRGGGGGGGGGRGGWVGWADRGAFGQGVGRRAEP